MLQTNTQADPLVEILRLAYRRGLALIREREVQRQADPQSIETQPKELQNKKVARHFVCWQCGEEKELNKYHAAGGELHTCKRCAGLDQSKVRVIRRA